MTPNTKAPRMMTSINSEVDEIVWKFPVLSCSTIIGIKMSWLVIVILSTVDEDYQHANFEDIMSIHGELKGSEL